MRFNHSVQKAGNKPIERIGCAFGNLPLKHPVDLINVPLMQRNKDGLFVGKVLVDRTNADTRCLSNVVGRNRGRARALEESDYGVQDSVNGLLRPLLNRLAPVSRTPGWLLHIQ